MHPSLNIPLEDGTIALLVGPAGSGTSTLLAHLVAGGQLKASEIVSSDASYPPNSGEYRDVSEAAFEPMEQLLKKRAALNKVSFVDATHLQQEERTKMVQLAKKWHVPIVAIVMNTKEETLFVHDQQLTALLQKEGFSALYEVTEHDDVTLERRFRVPRLNAQHGLDIIGDIHGCYDELMTLLERLGYEQSNDGLYRHPHGRKLLSLGDLTSRGPKSIATLQFFLAHVAADLAYVIDSNHGWKVARWLDGRNVTMTHGDERVVAEFSDFAQQHGAEAAAALKQAARDLLLAAPAHYMIQLDGTTTAVVTHAGIRDRYIGKASRRISDFCRYGDVQGIDENGKPLRGDWHLEHKTAPLIIWGHDPKLRPLRLNNTLNIDQGCVFGGQLTAFRYPEETFVAVDAQADYAQMVDNPITAQKNSALK